MASLAPHVAGHVEASNEAVLPCLSCERQDGVLDSTVTLPMSAASAQRALERTTQGLTNRLNQFAAGCFSRGAQPAFMKPQAINLKD
jgi:hypothetical protein